MLYPFLVVEAVAVAFLYFKQKKKKFKFEKSFFRFFFCFLEFILKYPFLAAAGAFQSLLLPFLVEAVEAFRLFKKFFKKNFQTKGMNLHSNCYLILVAAVGLPRHLGHSEFRSLAWITSNRTQWY